VQKIVINIRFETLKQAGREFQR